VNKAVIDALGEAADDDNAELQIDSLSAVRLVNNIKALRHTTINVRDLLTPGTTVGSLKVLFFELCNVFVDST
jgi:acyl carrier protein